jgi:predicted TIM-barrel fold metal-dependent hydrolase
MTDTKFAVPPNATDCHHHIYDARYPADLASSKRPPDALIPAYRALQSQLGLTRNIIVQPSTYGTDNRCMLDALDAFEGWRAHLCRRSRHPARLRTPGARPGNLGHQLAPSGT